MCPHSIIDDPGLLTLSEVEDDYNYPSSPTPFASYLPPQTVIPAVLGLRPHLQLPLAPLRTPRSPAPDLIQTPQGASTRCRASSLPAGSSPGPIWTTPVVGTKEQRKAINRRHGIAKRNEAKNLEKGIPTNAPSNPNIKPSTTDYLEVLDQMKKRGIDMGNLNTFFFDPANKLGAERWNDFFRKKGCAAQLLSWWISPSNSDTGRREVEEWAESHVAGQVAKEAEQVNCFVGLFTKLKGTYARITMRVFEALTRSSRQLRKGLSPARLANKQVIMVSAFASCLTEFSRSNNLLKRLFSLYLYASGAQRQVLTVLGHIGITESYSNLVAKVTEKRKTPGPLPALSWLLHGITPALTTLRPTAHVYDNINFADRVGEQNLGRTNTVESGTCTTVFPLHNAKFEDMKLDEFNEAFDKAKPLEVDNILHTPEEAKFFNECLEHCILRIIVNHGGEGFRSFRKKLDDTIPETPQQIKDYVKTALHPLPAWKIDESTIVGNAEVDAAIVEELQLCNQPTIWMKHVRIIAGDQLTIARLRTLANLRAGHEGGYNSFSWGAWMPGLFHTKMADMHGFLITHFGKANAGTRNPGCLAFHNTLLHHLPISITSPPTFRICRDLVFVSLYARTLHCLLLVSRHSTLEAYTDSMNDWDTLYRHAQEILQRFANPKHTETLRQERAQGRDGDMVFENAVLFLRDALISREFTDAVKKGDSGRVLLVLKVLALSFRGNGRSKYAYEMLCLIHNIKKVWPPKIVAIIMDNWLLNPTGKPNSFVEVYLVQEHMNYWIKVFYKAHGPNSTWEWLEMISPCVYALRHLATAMKKLLGTDISTRHSPVDLSVDIGMLMSSLGEHNVYKEVAGRILDKDDMPVTDIVSAGLSSLFHGPALDEYNAMFIRGQERRHVKPLIGMETAADSPGSSPPEAASPSRPTTSGSPGPQETNPVHSPRMASTGVRCADVEVDLTDDEDADGEAESDEESSGEGAHDERANKEAAKARVTNIGDTQTNDLDSALDEDEEETLGLRTFEDVAFDMDTFEEEEEPDLDEEEGQAEASAFTVMDILTS